jgi:rhodanese-related sulfurtransferase
MEIEKMIREGASLVDVRTPMEFMEGNATGSLNIPLNEIPTRLEEFRSLPAPVIVFCKSGGRSSQAQSFLSTNGIESYNAGTWNQVQSIVSKSK